MIRIAICLAALSWLPASAAIAEPCRSQTGAAPSRPRATACKPEERLVPYDPDRVPTGRSSGFVDLGNGTLLRVGGRARLDVDRR